MVGRHRTRPVPVSSCGTLTASRSPHGDAGKITNLGKSFKGPPQKFSAKELGRLIGIAGLFPGAAQRILQLLSLAFPSRLLGLDPLLEVAPLGFQRFRPLVDAPARAASSAAWAFAIAFSRLARSFSRAASSFGAPRPGASARARTPRQPCANPPRSSWELARRFGSGRRLFFGLAPSSSRSGRSACSAKGPLDPAGRFSTTPGFAIVAATTSGSSVSLACPWWKRLLPAPHASSAAFIDGAAIARS